MPGHSKSGAAMNRDFVEMLDALSDAKADFLIVGAHALAAHGVLAPPMILASGFVSMRRRHDACAGRWFAWVLADLSARLRTAIAFRDLEMTRNVECSVLNVEC